MVTAASEMELFLPKSYDIFWSLVILIIVAVFFYKFFLPKFQPCSMSALPRSKVASPRPNRPRKMPMKPRRSMRLS